MPSIVVAAGTEMAVATRPQLSHLRALESEAIHVMREVAAELEKPVLLFSGGKDSLGILELCRPWLSQVVVVWINTADAF